ncbi:MAG: hypothetical protein DMG65_19855 [Candidatus Angelobacter sp. Gp1-AA117]|nr:MAG: hypothetical protein DMG65_19855 [Candidatus Angelobacter sp. Gp1-AA117]
MRFTGRAVLIAILFIGVFAALLGAQNKPDVPKYDLSHQQVFTGIVGQLKDYQCPVSGMIGTHLALKEITETLEVHMAPAAFMKEYGIVIHPGEKVQVTGVKVLFDGKPAVLARSVSVRNETFSFRDEKGRPLW